MVTVRKQSGELNSFSVLTTAQPQQFRSKIWLVKLIYAPISPVTLVPVLSRKVRGFVDVDLLFIVVPNCFAVGLCFLCAFLCFCCAAFSDVSRFAIILLGKKELVAYTLIV